jgi:Major Facilitator Superfamily
MLQRLGLSLSAVLALSVFSQFSNLLFLRVWGSLADRFGIKAILSVSASLYLFVILGWTFTTLPERYFMLIPLLVTLHFLAGIASAGVTIGTATIGMKLAPKGQATSYLSAAAIATSLGAGLGPLLGGWFADLLSARHVSLNFTESWFGLHALNFTGFDFVFAIAFVLGLITLNSLVALREEGEASREIVLEALFARGQQFSRPMSSVPGLNFLGHFPYGYLKRTHVPGLDVAVGVTSYEIADITRKAVTAITGAGRTTVRIAKELEDALQEVGKAAAHAIPAHRFEVSRHAVRGAMLGTSESLNTDIGQVSHAAVTGVMRALRWGRRDPRDALRGAGYGAVQGAAEVGADLADATIQAMKAARELAQHTGLTTEAAEAQVAKGALAAAKSLDPEAAARVRASIPENVIQDQVVTEPAWDSPNENGNAEG